MSANNGRSSIFAKNIAIMAPNAFCRYPDGRNTLVDIISACDNARLPVGPFSSDWKHARDEQNSKLTRPTTPLDLAIPFFVRPPAAGGESQDQPIGFLRPDVAQAMKEYNSQQGDQPIFDFLGDKEDPWGVAFTQALNDPDAEHAFALRTRAMNRMVEIWRDDGKFPENLKGEPTPLPVYT